MTDPQSAPMGEQELTSLAEELREYTAMKYAGDCKCGKCQLVPRALVDRLYSALRAAASPRLAVEPTDEMVIAALNAWHPSMAQIAPKMGGWAQSKKDEMREVLRAAISLLGPAHSESVGWRTIESAPKDGTKVDLWAVGTRWTDCYWGKPPHECGEAGQYCDSCPPDDNWCDCYSYITYRPTHWMPLPAPPTSHPSQDRPADENMEGK